MSNILEQIKKSVLAEAKKVSEDDDIEVVDGDDEDEDVVKSERKRVKEARKKVTEDDEDEDEDGDEEVVEKKKRTVKEAKKKKVAEDEDEDEDDSDEDDEEEVVEKKKRTVKEAKKKVAEDDEDDDDDDDSDEDDDEDEEEVEVESKVKKVAKKKIAEHLDALLGDDRTLTEEFRTKTRVIFEAAVTETAVEAVNAVARQLKAKQDRQTELFMERTIDNIDAYLDKVISEWLEENQVAMEHNIRADIAESFLHGLKNLFETHYIDIPDDKVDVVEELVSQVETLEANLNKEVNNSIRLQEQLKELAKEKVIAESAVGFSENEKERLRLLAEGMEYEDEETFEEKMNILKDRYFKRTAPKSLIDEDEQLVIEETVHADDYEADDFVAGLSRYMRKKP